MQRPHPERRRRPLRRSDANQPEERRHVGRHQQHDARREALLRRRLKRSVDGRQRFGRLLRGGTCTGFIRLPISLLDCFAQTQS